MKLFSSLARKVLDNAEDVKELVDLDFNQVIYLGAGPFFGLAHEAQLKILELTAGQSGDHVRKPSWLPVTVQNLLLTKIPVVWSLVQRKTTPAKYDLDLVREVAGDHIARRVVLLRIKPLVLKMSKKWPFGCGGVLNDIYRVFPYPSFMPNSFAPLTSLKVENKPDTPSPTGTVNRGTRCYHPRIPKVIQYLRNS